LFYVLDVMQGGYKSYCNPKSVLHIKNMINIYIFFPVATCPEYINTTINSV
jgi:hypothetical protein